MNIVGPVVLTIFVWLVIGFAGWWVPYMGVYYGTKELLIYGELKSFGLGLYLAHIAITLLFLGVAIMIVYCKTTV